MRTRIFCAIVLLSACMSAYVHAAPIMDAPTRRMVQVIDSDPGMRANVTDMARTYTLPALVRELQALVGDVLAETDAGTPKDAARVDWEALARHYRGKVRR